MKVSLTALSALLLCVGVVALPKMGVIVGPIPIYLSLVAGSGLASVGWVMALRRATDPMAAIGMALVLLVIGLLLGHATMFGVGEPMTARSVARRVFSGIALFNIGLAFYFLYSPASLVTHFIRCFRWAFIFVMLYAVLQLLVGAETVAIRGVTALYAEDFDEVINQHNVIHRLGGNYFKLFSTYENGNLFALAMCIMFPFYFYFESSHPMRIGALLLFHFVMLMSASATGFVGVAVIDLLILPQMLRTYGAGIPVALAALTGAFYYYLVVLCSTFECFALRLVSVKLLERDVGGDPRWIKVAAWLDQLAQRPWDFLIGQLSSVRDGWDVFEVLPISILQYYGFAVVVLFYTLLLWLIRPWHYRPYKAGMIAYLVITNVSGGYWLSPTSYLVAIFAALCFRLDELSEPAGRRVTAARTLRPATP